MAALCSDCRHYQYRLALFTPKTPKTNFCSCHNARFSKHRKLFLLIQAVSKDDPFLLISFSGSTPRSHSSLSRFMSLLHQ